MMLNHGLTDEQLDIVEDQLSNNEVSSQDELFGYFCRQGLTEEQARIVLEYRVRYLNNTYKQPFTPLRSKKPLRFNPHARQFEEE